MCIRDRLTPALDVVGHHHERWDGAGYPHKLQGDAIPFPARIFAVVDSLDAMTHDRPWRPALSLGEALATLRAEAGSHFDPRIVEEALKIGSEEWAALLELRGTSAESAGV